MPTNPSWDETEPIDAPAWDETEPVGEVDWDKFQENIKLSPEFLKEQAGGRSWLQADPQGMGQAAGEILSDASAVAGKVGQGLHILMAPFETVGAQGINTFQASQPIVQEQPTPAEPGVPFPGIMPPDNAVGVIPSLRRGLGGLTTPGSLLALPLAPESGLVKGAFQAGAAATIPPALEALYRSQTPEETAGALTDLGIGAGFYGLLSKGKSNRGESYARSKQEAAAIHGDVRPQSFEGNEAVPIEEGGTRVLASDAGTQAAPEQVPLTELGEGRWAASELTPDAYKIKEVRPGVYEFSRLPKRAPKLRQDELGEAPSPAAEKPVERPESELTPEERAQLDQLQIRVDDGQELNPAQRQSYDQLRTKASLETLSDEHRALIEDGSDGLDVEVDINPGAGDGPFAANRRIGGQFMGINRAKGTIEVYPSEFKAWLEEVPPAQRAQAVRSRLAEERIHLATDDAAAKTYWSNLTGLERKISERRYLGQRSRAGISDTMMGHESLRFRLQQLSDLTPSELAETAGREHWTLKGLTIVESAIRGVRETLGTKASREQQAILGRIQSNIDFAKTVLRGGNPAAVRRQNVTIERPDGSTYDAEFNGYYDLRPYGGKLTPSIGRTIESGDKSHGMLNPGEKIVSEVPSFEEWSKAQSNPAAVRRGGLSKSAEERIRKAQELTAAKLAAEQGETYSTAAGEHLEALKPTYELPTPKALDDLAEAHIASERPSFEDFLGDAQVKFGKIERGAMLEKWGDALNSLVDAPGSLLEELVDELGLRGQIVGPTGKTGKSGVPIMDRELKIPDARTARAGGQDIEVTRAQAIKRSELLVELAGKLERQADSAAKSLQAPEAKGFNRLSMEGDVTSLRARANKLRQQADALIDRVKQGKSLPVEKVPKVMKQQTPSLFGEQTFKTSDQPLEEGQTTAQTGADRARARAISAITTKLWDEATGRTADLKRANVTPEEIRWSRADEAYEDISDVAPEDVGRQATKGAGMDRTTKTVSGQTRVTRKALPESATKRLVVLQDKQSGKVHLVSAYRDAGQPVVVDPAHPSKAHQPFEKVMKRYRALYSVLLDEPVQNFHKAFEDLGEYNEKFGDQAQELLKENAHGEYGMGPAEGFEAEGTPGLKGQPGYNPHGVLESGADLMPEESRALYDVFDAMERPQDAHDYFASLRRRAEEGASKKPITASVESLSKHRDNLVQQAKYEIGKRKEALEKNIADANERLATLRSKSSGGLTARDRQVISGMKKVYEAIASEPESMDLTQGQLIERTIDEIYDTAKRHETRSSFVEGAARRFARELPLPAEPASKASPTEREIVAPRAAAHISGVGRGLRDIFQNKKLADEMASGREFRQRARNIQESATAGPVEQSPGDRARAQGSRMAEEAKAEADAEMAAEQGESPAAVRRKLPKRLGGWVSDAIRNTGSLYDTWMVDRIARSGGPRAKAAAEGFKLIIDRQKELYGSLTGTLDKARIAAGGSRKVPVMGQVPSPEGIKATTWLHGLDKVTPFAATSRTVGAIEGTRPVPAYAQNVVDMARDSNIESGRMAFAASGKGEARGLFQRNPTALGYDAVRQGSGELLRKWIAGSAKANKAPISVVRGMFREWKEALDTPGVEPSVIDKINQDFARKLPNVITHVRANGQWQEVVHSNLFGYLENTAQRASHIAAFREHFPNNVQGRRLFRTVIDGLRTELGPSGQADLDGLIRTMQGHPTDNYSNMGSLSPTEPLGSAFRTLNNTVGNLMAKAVLTGQILTQPGELIAGSTPAFLGAKNYLRGLARLKQLYPELEQAGAVNRVMYDFSFDPNSPVRSAFRLAGNALSKGFAEQLVNELQEAGAAATARVVSERIKSKQLTDWEQRMLPETLRSMGFTTPEIHLAMQGDPQTLAQFERMSAAFLTSGNKAIAEGSRLGANRLLNSIFRFQLYPMMKANQFRQVASRFADVWKEGTPAKERRAATEQMARFVAGNTLQGALTVALTTLGFSGMSGLKIRAQEAKDEPMKFLTESFLSSLSGPLYLAWRGSRDKGLLGVGEQATRMVFPYTATRELIDMASGHGQYRDTGTFDRIGKFLANKTPGTKAIGTGLAIFGLGSDSRELDTAISAFYRWRRQELGFSEREDFLREDERKAFRTSMRKVTEALKEGDRKKFNEAYLEAIGEAARGEKAVAGSLRARRLLKTPDGKALSLEQLDNLRNRIGDEAVDRLQHFDSMLEAAANGEELLLQ